jgi:hypothetical protein
MKLTIAAFAAILIVMGAYEVAFAQQDGCKLDVRRDNRTGIIWLFGGCSGTCNGGSNNCVPGTITDTYGMQWSVCLCDDLSALCLLGFMPWSPGGSTGMSHCFQWLCPIECEPESFQTQDPEVDSMDCLCLG